jgi:cyclophilin family peptidyl-prolyl cis-trans isomerase
MKKAFAVAVGSLFFIGIVLVFFSTENKPDLPQKATQTSSPPPTKELTSKVEGSSSAKEGTNQSPKENKMPKQYAAYPQMVIDQNKTYTATLQTSKGQIVLELFAKEAPKTVNNFVFLARDGFYDGTTFHRIIKGFMIQGGDPLGNGTGGPGYKFDDEPVTKNYDRGALAMANAGPNTNGSQFFIMHQNYAPPKDYTIFGQVTKGLEVVDQIAETPVAGPENSTPTETVTISKITIEEK